MKGENVKQVAATHRMELQQIVDGFRGLTADEIAAMMRRRGIKARMGTTSRCPMALLLGGEHSGRFVIGRKYIARQSGERIDKVHTPKNVAQFMRKFDIAGYPDLIAPPPRCVAREARKKRPRGSDTRPPRQRPREIKNHLAKLVDRFGVGVTP